MTELLTRWLQANPCPLPPLQAIAEGQVLLGPGLRHLPGATLHHVHVFYQDGTPTPAVAVSTLLWQGVLWGRTGPLRPADIEARINGVFEDLKAWKPMDFFHSTVDGDKAMALALRAEQGTTNQTLFAPAAQTLGPWTQALEVFLQSMIFSQHLEKTLPGSASLPSNPSRRKVL